MGQAPRLLRHGGFSLIELLVATALAAVLAVGVLKVVASFADAAAGPTGDDAALRRAAELIRGDFLHADVIEVSTAGDGFTLIGDLWLDDDAGRTMRPAMVTYGLTQLGNEQVLTRTQQDAEYQLGGLLVLRDVEGLVIERGGAIGSRPIERPPWVEGFTSGGTTSDRLELSIRAGGDAAAFRFQRPPSATRRAP